MKTKRRIVSGFMAALMLIAANGIWARETAAEPEATWDGWVDEESPYYRVFTYSDSMEVRTQKEFQNLNAPAGRVGYLYSQDKATGEVYLLSSGRVKLFYASRDVVVFVDEDFQLKISDYTGSVVNKIWDTTASQGQVQLVMHRKNLYVAKNGEITLYEALVGYGETVAHCENLKSFTVVNQSYLAWENTEGKRFLHRIFTREEVPDFSERTSTENDRCITDEAEWQALLGRPGKTNSSTEENPYYQVFTYTNGMTLPGIDTSACREGYSYVYEIAKKELSLLTSQRVKYLQTAKFAVYCATEKGRVIETDYSGRILNELYPGLYGGIAGLEVWQQNTLFILDGDRVIRYNTEDNTFRVIAQCPDIQSFKVVSMDSFAWTNRQGERLLHSVPAGENDFAKCISTEQDRRITDDAEWKAFWGK